MSWRRHPGWICPGRRRQPRAEPASFCPRQARPAAAPSRSGLPSRLFSCTGRRHADPDHRGRPRGGVLSGQGVSRGGPRGRPRRRRPRRLRHGRGRRLRRARRRPHAAEARRPLADPLPARAGRRDAGADPVRPRPGRRPREGPAGRRRRLSPQALRLLRAPRPGRGAGAPPRRAATRSRPSIASAISSSTGCRIASRARATRSCCSRASSGCSNT